MTKEKTPKNIHCLFDKLEDVDALISNPRNPNTHPEKQIKLLAKNIEHLGFRHPVLVSKRSGFIVAGHGRLEAAKILGLKKVPVVLQNFESEAKEYAFLIADNRLQELSEMNESLRKELLSELDGELGLEDIELTGFEDCELESMMTSGKSITENTFSITVDCDSESHREETLNRLREMNLRCKAS